MTYALAVIAAVALIGGILFVSMTLTDRKAGDKLLRNKENTSEDSGVATEDGYSIAGGSDGGGGD